MTIARKRRSAAIAFGQEGCRSNFVSSRSIEGRSCQPLKFLKIEEETFLRQKIRQNYIVFLKPCYFAFLKIQPMLLALQTHYVLQLLLYYFAPKHNTTQLTYISKAFVRGARVRFLAWPVIWFGTRVSGVTL